MTKQRLRERLLQRLRQQPEQSRQAKSLKIARALARLALYRRAKVVLCYASIDGEVETRFILRKILADGKRAAVPVVVRRGKRLIAAEIRDPDLELKPNGPFRIPEPSRLKLRPISPLELDLVLVPGVAFDRAGRRLGRGGGYFDRFLTKVQPEIPRVGLAFKFQLLRQLPGEPHDQPVGRVITE
ncbi:MAG: 5-formyltetrahydrofolate cyclo-ligase [Candidatus Omnitrophica bacterium]|nr:5-formyltetrahydrofolate cyclo-ligase [Candidatus Omnitrophota bacterium]